MRPAVNAPTTAPTTPPRKSSTPPGLELELPSDQNGHGGADQEQAEQPTEQALVIVLHHRQPSAGRVADTSAVKPLVPPGVLVVATAAVIVGWVLVLDITTGLLTLVH